MLDQLKIYTHVAIRALKEIHTATHPARLERMGDTREQEVTRLRKHEYSGSSRHLIGMPESRGERRAAAKAAGDAVEDGDGQP